MLYLAALRISEALRLQKKQFQHLKTKVLGEAILLSKRRNDEKVRSKTLFRDIRISLTGERKDLGHIVKSYLVMLKDPEEQLFTFNRITAWRITTTMIGVPNHWLRAYGEEYLYRRWNKNLLAVADYVKVDPKILAEYLRDESKNYPVV